ncbi:MAG: DUF1552 domain-containing protein [Fimbriimonadales bacterium]|jgi:hypothetical protein|nr:DUF1552 domain-containing protein [Fimbriimonadales bacterium]
MNESTRREFLKHLGISAASVPFLTGLPSLALAESLAKPKQRLIILFSPDGVVPTTFWPDEVGTEFTLKQSLKPLEPFKNKTLILNGVCDRVRGDGDNHMRGIGCLLTGSELFPGNIQGGSDTPAGWSSGISIDQEIKNYLQKSAITRTRFGSLEFGVMVPEHADTWTRMVYAGANKPVAPIDDPYLMFQKLYGSMKDKELLKSVLDDLSEDIKKVKTQISKADQKLLDEHMSLVRDMETEIKSASKTNVGHKVPDITPGVRRDNNNIPQISKLQIDLMVSAFLADSARVATLQYTNSVGQARFTWLGIQEGQHDLSHEPDSNKEAQEKLTKINQWYCEQLAYLAKKLSETKEPDGNGTLLDNTTIVWTNELGQGNSHTLENIPFVVVGGGLGFKMGRSMKYDRVPHNRLLMSLAHGFGHRIESFGNRDFCGAGPLQRLS